MDFSVVDVQRRLGHRKPDITLRIYTHEWKYRDAQRSQIGRQIDRVFRADGPKVLTAAETGAHRARSLPQHRLRLPAVSGSRVDPGHVLERVGSKVASPPGRSIVAA